MKTSKKIVSFSHTNGTGVARDKRGRLVVISNRKDGKKLRSGDSVFVVSQQRRDIVR